MNKPRKLSKRHRRPSKAAINTPNNLRNKLKLSKDAKARRRAEQLSKLPKNPIKRFFYYWNPKNFADYWFNRDGLIRFIKLSGIAILVFLIISLGLFAYFRKDLPKNITDLKTCTDGASTLYYDRTGETLLWSSSGDVECYPVPQDQLSKNLQNAVIAVEDKDFYKHGGFSTAGIIRSAVNNARGESLQGGSTITQQFVKNSLLTQNRDIVRKLKELILSTELERNYSKDEILTAYLNEISFGSRFSGAEAASKGYFNKSAKDLTIDEAAMLAAMIKAPTYYSPQGENANELIDRKNYVIKLMREQGYISQEQEEEAKNIDVLAKVSTTRPSKYQNIKAPYFVTEVQKQLEEEYGATNAQKAGFKVITTLDLNLQSAAEEAVNQAIPKLERIGGNNMAAVAQDVDTGQVLAMAGGRGWDYPTFGQINYATTPRSPGSSFKPYDYASLMTQKPGEWGPGSTLYDSRTNFSPAGSAPWIPKNYDSRYPGAMSMRKSLGGSRNIPAIKSMYMSGIQNTHDLAKKMGLKSGVTGCYVPGKEDCGQILSTAIGDGGQIKLSDNVSGFSTFARMGVYKPQTYILSVKDIKNKTIKEYQDTPGEQVLDEQIAYSINDMLSDPSASYFGNTHRLTNFKSAIKTGTTNNQENGWFMGYTPHIVFGMWAGHHENKSMVTFTETILGTAWRQFMTKAHADKPKKEWNRPATMKRVCINTVTGYATNAGGVCDYFPSRYNPKFPNNSIRATIDSVSGKLATECTPERAKQSVSGGGIASELPSSDPLYNNWITPVRAQYGVTGGAIPTEKDDIHSCDPADKPTVSIDEPIKNADGTYTISANVAKGKYPLQSISFSINGTPAPGGSFDITNSQKVSFTYTPPTPGVSSISANVIDSVLYDATSTKDFNFN